MNGGIAAVGDRGTILIWRAIGARTVFCDTREEAEKAVKSLAKQGYAIIYITENCAQMIPDVIDRYKEKKTPAIIPIPGKDGKTGFSEQILHKTVEKAIGADILNKEESN
ncbi:MAG: V-type ATP synthase subunit F [Oscillospiraceae bacterium]|jgi:V/A-type H+-transporting ATPase subunit F